MHFVYLMVCSSKSESAQTKNIMDTAYPRGVASHPITPAGSALDSVDNLTTVKALELRNFSVVITP